MSTPTFLVAAEDRAGFVAVTTLTDRVVVEAVPWTRDVLEYIRVWARPDHDTPWISLSHRTTSPRRRARGHFNGEPGAPDAANTRRVLLDVMARHATSPIDALMIARDLDRDPRRLVGMRQAIESATWPFHVLVAWAEPEAESWYLAGFIPTDDAEVTRLREISRELGFDPTSAPHRATSTAKSSARDSKRLLDHLCPHEERRQACLSAPLGHLMERGRHAGVSAFLDEVRARIVPLFTQRPRP